MELEPVSTCSLTLLENFDFKVNAFLVVGSLGVLRTVCCGISLSDASGYTPS